MTLRNLIVDDKLIQDFCRKWRVVEFALFGSVLRDDFTPNSDVDVLLTFQPNAPWDLWDMVDMREELKEIFGREVDLVEKAALKNPFRKKEILENMKVIYAA